MWCRVTNVGLNEENVSESKYSANSLRVMRLPTNGIAMTILVHDYFPTLNLFLAGIIAHRECRIRYMKRWCLVLLCMLAQFASAQLSFDYQNVTTNDVIYSMSKLTNTTIVAPTINQRISLQAKDVSASEALRILDTQLGLMKYKLHRESTLYVVRPVGFGVYDYQPNPEDITIHVLQIQYNNAINVANILRDVIARAVNQRNWNRLLLTRAPALGEVILVPTEVPPTITADSFTNSVIIRGTKAQINEIIAMIQMLDVAVDDSYEVRVIHLQYADAFTMQTILSQSMPVVVGASSNVYIGAYGYGNAIIIRCPTAQWVHINGLIVALDTRVPYANTTTVIRTVSGSSVVLSELLRSVFGRR